MASACSTLFQPSSDLQAGCNLAPPAHQGILHISFNPHPTFRPDATDRRGADSDHNLGFNPHPTFRPDATMSRWTLAVINSFQPSSDLQAGCNLAAFGMYTALHFGFNPHPTFRPDATRRIDGTDVIKAAQFQPSSDLQAGCNLAAFGMYTALHFGFNPHPTFRPDATRRIDGTDVIKAAQFQPSSDLQAGCNLVGAGDVKAVRQVSTLIRPSGRMQPGPRRRSSLP